MRTLALAIVFTSSLVAQAAAQDGLALMRVEAGARPAGMAGTFTAVNGDPIAALYNPAGLSGLKQVAFSAAYHSYWENISIGSAVVGGQIRDNWYLGGSIRYASVGDIEQRSIASILPEATFSAYDFGGKAVLAHQATERLVVGVAAGWFIEKISTYRGTAFNADLGAHYLVTNDLTAGVSVLNLGSDFNLSDGPGDTSRTISLPTTYRAGVSYVWNERYRGAADVVYLDDEAYGHLGAEAIVHRHFQVRAGYMLGYDSKNFTAGASFARYGLRLDYAFVPYSESLGTTHLFGLTVDL